MIYPVIEEDEEQIQFGDRSKQHTPTPVPGAAHTPPRLLAPTPAPMPPHAAHPIPGRSCAPAPTVGESVATGASWENASWAHVLPSAITRWQ